MVIGHNAETAKYILTGNSIEDLEKGLAEMKRQIANGITFSVCASAGGDTSDFEKEYDSEYSDDCDCDIYCCGDDCDKCDYDEEDYWNIQEFDHEEDYDPCEDCDEVCHDGLCPREVAEEEANDEEVATEQAVNEFIKIIKDILGM